MAQSKTHALRISYDKRADVLYLAFGTPQVGIDREVSEGVFVRLDERTEQALGLTIVDFEKRFSRPLTESVPIDLAQFLVSA